MMVQLNFSEGGVIKKEYFREIKSELIQVIQTAFVKPTEEELEAYKQGFF